MSIRTILVDDEKLATQGLEMRLAPFEDVEIVATCLNGREAIRKIKTLKPDLVFLDIQMPGFDGFSVVQGVMDIDPPLFVFVTAYSDHAIKAFEAQAVDYLMKPVEQDRLADTMDRVRARLADRRTAEEVERLRSVINEVAPEAVGNMPPPDEEMATSRFEKLINVKDRGQIFRVDVETHRTDRGGGRLYVHLSPPTTSLILRETMKDLEKRLDPRTFQRVHRSHHRQPGSGPAGQTAHQWRMLSGAGIGRAGEGFAVVSGCCGEVCALMTVTAPQNRSPISIRLYPRNFRRLCAWQMSASGSSLAAGGKVRRSWHYWRDDLRPARPDYAWRQQVAADDPAIVTERPSVPSPQGNGTIAGLLARPAKAKGKIPAVLVIHENRGLNPYIEDVARRLAKSGYLAFAPDGADLGWRLSGQRRQGPRVAGGA